MFLKETTTINNKNVFLLILLLFKKWRMLFLHFPLASSNAPKIEEVHSIPKVPEPKYKIIKEPPEGIPEFLVIEIALPGIVSAMKFLF